MRRPYHPNAIRNRPTETQRNIVGRRYGVHPTSQERYKGSSEVVFADSANLQPKDWRTTNQAFQACYAVSNTVGLANPGISSRVAKEMHATQGIYGVSIKSAL